MTTAEAMAACPTKTIIVFAAFVAWIACSTGSDGGDDDESSGGAGHGGGGDSSRGGNGSDTGSQMMGGTAGASGGAGGSAVGGSPAGGAGGMAPNGGQMTGGQPMGGQTTGGQAAGGQAVMGGRGGASMMGGAGMGGAGMTTASAGCGKAGRPANGEVVVDGEYVLTFPETYDGMKPMPVVFGFHGANRTHIEFRSGDAGTRGTDFERRYVIAYVKSIGTNWSAQQTAQFARFDSVMTVLANNHCIDTKRIFAIGHSSGAWFISNLVCRPEPRLRAVVPVASSTLAGTCRMIPALLIHGKTDAERAGGDGAAHVMQFVMRNGCMTTSTPSNVPTCASRQDNATVNPGCKEYQGCGANPTIWCSHDDPFYSGTNHGWPCFANKAILDFFARF